MIAPDGGGTVCVVPGGATRCTSEVIVMGATNGNQTEADKTPANPRKEIASSLRNLLANTAPLLLLVQQHLIHQ